MKKKNIATSLLVALVVAGFVVWSQLSAPPAQAHKVTVTKSPTCGCCVQYIAYLRKNGYEVEVNEIEDTSPYKLDHGIPGQLFSCHTMEIDDYLVEGHVPLKVVDQLLAEQPSVEGISLPKMPAGSPGMPGTKFGVWNFYSFKDGQIFDYTTL